MLYINRSIIIINPKQSFVDWLNSTDPEGKQCVLEDLNSDSNAYLVSEIDDDNDLARELKKHFKKMFENELMVWCLDKTMWPDKVTFSLFTEWFAVEQHSMVADLCEESLNTEEF